MEFIEAIWVTPGPLVIYNKRIFDEIGGFDNNNMTEDLEITWNLISHGYKVKMNVPARVYTIAPEKWKEWFNQRIRWNIGGYQAMIKYRKRYLNSGMLGYFLMPMFLFYWFISIFGLGLVVYRLAQWGIISALMASNSLKSNVALITLESFSLDTNILLIFGLALFGFSLIFTLMGYLDHKSECEEFKKPGFLSMSIYMIIYLALYPIIMIISMYRFARGKTKW